MLHRNVLKLRKEKRLAQERGEGSTTGTPAAHGQNGDKYPEVTGFEVDTFQSDPKAHAEQDNWREVCLLSIPCPPH
jgi:hypothetical protein